MNLAQLIGCFCPKFIQPYRCMPTELVKMKIGHLKPNFIQNFPCLSNLIILYNSLTNKNLIFKVFLKSQSFLLTIFS